MNLSDDNIQKDLEEINKDEIEKKLFNSRML
jgi:hypothetical protein